MKRRPLMPVVFIVVTLAACSKSSEKKENPARIGYTVQRSFPHDIKAFTEGLVIHDGQLYEGTGQFNTSWIGIVDIKTGATEKKVILGSEYFGEGITILNNKVYQLTYKTKKGFVYNLADFREIQQFSYSTEGWGLTHDNKNLIMSDGSDQLQFLDTVNFSVVRTLQVKDNIGPVDQLNELEYAGGYIYANVWQTNRIVRIDPQTGEITGVIDLASVAADIHANYPRADVLNGIAWHKATDSFLITGKYWPFIYVLKLKDA